MAIRILVRHVFKWCSFSYAELKPYACGWVSRGSVRLVVRVRYPCIIENTCR
jgi:hypothetical protein